jgi:hypothetical protein
MQNAASTGTPALIAMTRAQNAPSHPALTPPEF